MKTSWLWLVLVLFTCNLANARCIMTKDFLAGDSEDNMSKIYSLIREGDTRLLTMMLTTGQAKLITKGTRIFRADGGWFSSTVTVGVSPKRWIVDNGFFRCTDPGPEENSNKGGSSSKPTVSPKKTQSNTAVKSDTPIKWNVSPIPSGPADPAEDTDSNKGSSSFPLGLNLDHIGKDFPERSPEKPQPTTFRLVIDSVLFDSIATHRRIWVAVMQSGSERAEGEALRLINQAVRRGQAKRLQQGTEVTLTGSATSIIAEIVTPDDKRKWWISTGELKAAQVTVPPVDQDLLFGGSADR